jgi:hypothetical protein
MVRCPHAAERAPTRPAEASDRDGYAESLEELAESLDREAGIADNARHGDGIHGVVSRNGEDAGAVGHDDVLALTNDAKAGFLQGAYGSLMAYPWQFGHASGYVDFAYLGPGE